MSLTRKIGAYLCNAAMVFSLNVRSNALFKESLQGFGIFVEIVGGVNFSVSPKKSVAESDEDKNFISSFISRISRVTFRITWTGLLLLIDAIQRTYFLAFGDEYSKTEKTDNKEVNKKNEKKVENA